MRALEGDVSLDDLHEGVRQGSIIGSGSSSEYDMYRKPRVMSNPDFTNSSDYGLTSEFSNSSGGNSQEMSRPSPGIHYPNV